jgi:hypothetical protein
MKILVYFTHEVFIMKDWSYLFFRKNIIDKFEIYKNQEVFFEDENPN